MPRSAFSPIRPISGNSFAAKTFSKKFNVTRTLSFEMVLRDWYLDRPEIDRAIRRARLDKSRLMRMAGSVRTIAKRSIRKRKSQTPSPPGTPPRSRAPGHPMRLISFGFNPYNATMVVGAEYLRRTSGTTVPSVHEFGKRIMLRHAVRRKPTRKVSPSAARWYKKKRKAGLIPPPPIIGWSSVSTRYNPRPFMRPALAKSKSSFPKVWRNSVRSF